MHILEIVVDADQAQSHLSRLRGVFPNLALVAQSEHFGILGCRLPTQLHPVQSTQLSELTIAKTIYHYQCKKQEGPLRNEGINYPQA